MYILLVSIFFFLAFYFLYLGMRVVITKKPFLMASKSTFWLLLLAFLPNIILPIHGYWDMYSTSTRYSLQWEWTNVWIVGVPLLLYPALLVFYWRLLRGYTVLGVTDESFRQALYSVLNDINIPFEERLSKLHFTSIGADVEANVNSWLGTASIRIKQKEHQELLDHVASGLRGYFAGSHTATNMVTPVYYLIFGVGILGAAAALGYVIWSRSQGF